MSIAPVVCTIDVKTAPARTFDLFTQRMGDWWTGKTIGAKPHVAIVIEPETGGRWFERAADGDETLWGRVLVWTPPVRLVLAWQLDSRFVYDPNTLTEVEISFSPTDGGGTRLRLEHRNLERYGREAEYVAGLIGKGWPQVLAGFEPFTIVQHRGAAP